MNPGRNFVQWLRDSMIPRAGSRAQRPSMVPGVLSRGEVRVVFQPVLDLESGQPFAYEALARSTSPHFSSPPALFDDAIESECCGALGRVIRELATEGCPEYPLFVNVHPNEFAEGWLVQPDDPMFGHEHPIYLEITESVPLSHFALCHSLLSEVRHKGVALAVDDLGAGYSNLKYIADLAPEIVKIDRGLIANLAHHHRLQRLMRGIVALCDDLGAKVVAEGIETHEEALAVIDTGASYGQGFYFARPGFPPPPVPDGLLRREGNGR